jgi:hypothetical protein
LERMAYSKPATLCSVSAWRIKKSFIIKGFGIC